MRSYLKYEREIWRLAWSRTKAALSFEPKHIPTYAAGIGLGLLALWLLGGYGMVVEEATVIGAMVIGVGVLFLIMLGWQVATAPYRIWKGQKSKIAKLEQSLTSQQTRVSFEVGNGDEYLLGRSYYMMKVTNGGNDRSKCLIRLLTVSEGENQHRYNEVLPTKNQWENERRGEFNLRQDESKRVMLIGNFPNGWCFLLENHISEPFSLDKPIKVKVALLGSGPKSQATILIELLDPSTKLLRLTLQD